MHLIRRCARILAVLGAAMVPWAAQAQTGAATISGRITTADGGTIQGGVQIPELTVSVAAQENGRYTINIPGQRIKGQLVTLVARAIGYKPARKVITLSAGSQTVDFSLEKDVLKLNELVVTGVTGATEQRKVPFAVASVTEKDMPVAGANILTQLQGKVPGAAIVSASGRPGAEPAVLLRGPTSINASGRGQGPLYVVDGIILNGPLPDLNPLDIERIEVVRGAAAASLYGARAGNGVIQIQTKSGKTGGDGVKFGVRVEAGASDIERQFPLSQRTATFRNEAGTMCQSMSATEGGWTSAQLNQQCLRAVDVLTEVKRINQLGGDFALNPVNFQGDGGIALAPGRNNLRGFYQTNPWPQRFDAIASLVTPSGFTNTNLDVSGKSGFTKFFASASNFTQQGAIDGLEGYRRNTLRLNVDQNIGDWSVSLRTQYARTRQDGLNQSGGETGGTTGFFRLTRVPAFVDLRRTDDFGRLFIRTNPLNQGSQNDNPLYSFRNARRIDEGDRFVGAVTTRYAPLAWFDLEGNISIDASNSGYTSLIDRGYRTTAASPATNGGNIDKYGASRKAYNAYLNANIRREFGRALSSRLTLRSLYEQQDFTDRYSYGELLAVPGLTTSNNATTNFSISSGTSSVRQISHLADLNLEFFDRFIVSGLVRRDGSSLFGSAARWATFGRGSVAYVVSDEKWWKFKPISELKLRTSYGTAGGRPNFSAQYEAFSIGTGGTLNRVQLGNKDLRPEITSEVEMGADMELFRRISAQVNYAESSTRDQILPVPAPSASGFTTQWRNAGIVGNRTWEIQVNAPIIQARNFNWQTGLVYTRNRTTINALNIPEFFGGVGLQAAESIFKFAAGERLGNFYGRDWVRSCDQLPAPFNTQCGGAGAQYQKNSDGFIVWTGGRELTTGLTNNLWMSELPAASAPWGSSASWGMPILRRDAAGNPAQVLLGNATPDFRLAWSNTVTMGRLSIYGLLDGAFGQKIWNQGYHWSLGDFQVREVDQDAKSVADAKPLGYYWRAAPGVGGNPNGTGGFYDILGPNGWTVEDASFVKLRELNVSLRLGRLFGRGDWSVGVVGRNLITWTKGYRGFDPETGISGGQLSSAALTAVDRYSFPNLRTFTFSLASTF